MDAGETVAHPEWREMAQIETTTGTLELAWAPDGERLTIAAGVEVWEVTVGGEATRRHRFSVPEMEWTTLEWAADGGGYLVGLSGAGVGYAGHLYWFPADGTGAVLLLAGNPGAAGWRP